MVFILKSQSIIDGGNTIDQQNNWTMKTYIWMGLLVWFCANAISQAAFMGKWGTPYGHDLLDTEIGQWYWAMLLLELAFYAIGIMVVTSKMNLWRPKSKQSSIEQLI